jgi:group II intron reverse transcriptase/maturase
LADRLERLGSQLISGHYEVPALRGVVFEQANGKIRPLAIPPFLDRVAQRAVAQILTPGLEPLMYHGSFGYRPRRSRHGAKAMIEAAYREGYRWIYEADINDFFDLVDWGRLETRLRALYRDDPVVDLIRRWIGAPVQYGEQNVERSAGLPQGSPLSPVLANLLLDDFDKDIGHAGFRLTRFADDFVVLCKDRSEAEAAGAEVRRALAELGLGINPDKTGVRSFAQGFRYLGYVFVNGLALDVSGEKPPSTDTEPPPHSWLAKLTERVAIELAADGDQKKSTPSPAEASSARQPIRLGEQSREGVMVFVTGPPAQVTTRMGRLRILRDESTLVDQPWSQIQSLVLFGPHNVTTPTLRTTFKHAIPIHFASGSGRYQGTTWNGQPGAEGHAL